MNESELRLYKCELAYSKGYTYNPITGYVYGMRGDIVGTDSPFGYIDFYVRDENNKQVKIKAHVFGWYYIHKNIPSLLDHINQDKKDNRLVNLRPLTKQQNSFNKTGYKNYTYIKSRDRFCVSITLGKKKVFTKYVKTEQEAIELAKEVKEKYHKIENTLPTERQ